MPHNPDNFCGNFSFLPQSCYHSSFITVHYLNQRYPIVLPVLMKMSYIRGVQKYPVTEQGYWTDEECEAHGGYRTYQGPH